MRLLKKRKNKVVILSAMRSGSTLLKAILGSASDVSHIPEVDFQNENEINKYHDIVKEDIIVFKKPAWFNEIFDYPKLKRKRHFKKIILYRNPFDCIFSLKKMLYLSKIPFLYKSLNWFLLNVYWYSVYNNLYSKYCKDINAFFLDYDNFVSKPVMISKKLFRFIGSEKKEGTNEYTVHSKGWKWGIDDNSSKIKRGKVVKDKKIKNDLKLKNEINNSKKILNLMQKYNSFK